MTDTRARVVISIDDGSGCYFSCEYLDSFEPLEVAKKARDAALRIGENFFRDRVETGPWDPDAWREERRRKIAAMQKK